MASLTPMMQQYTSLKEKYKDCILMFRLGDFYEMFFEDAQTAARELELTLTGRDCGQKERAPMCGVPHHAVSGYIGRLLEKGYKVALCEQLEDPALAKGLVERDVIRVYTPGTLNDPAMLDERRSRYLLSIALQGKGCGLCWAEVSTGECWCEELPDAGALAEAVSRIEPSEVITPDLVRLRAAAGREMSAASEQPSGWFTYRAAAERLTGHFHLQNLAAFGLDGAECRLAVCAAGGLIRYLEETQKNALEHLTGVRRWPGSRHMLLDSATRRNLELTEGLRSRSRKGSLLGLLDRTATAMGGRLLRAWVEQPLLRAEDILWRMDAVDELCRNHVLAATLSEKLREVYDLERLLSKVSYRSLNGRDCLALGASLGQLPEIKDLLADCGSAALGQLRDQMNPLDDLRALLEKAISPDAPITITEGGLIRDGYSPLLDEYRAAATGGKQWILEMEQREREATGIRNLRVQYNRVFGYYIEVTKSFLSMVPERYIRRQTMANAERYVTPELREIEQKIVGAQEQSVRLEGQLFSEIRDAIAGRIAEIQQTASALKQLDCLLSLSLAAVENRYTRPEIVDDGRLEITAGRHPVVEQALSEAGFIPNDTLMNTTTDRMLIITGPNMAGKSTYLRQVALITLMAHIGSFVPADAAVIPLTDRIFTRVGASDDLASGQSTFMVEMSETAYILRSATSRSLVILDEIGRGTSTFDGLAIAWAVVEYLCDREKVGAKTLFATHYHELSELEGRLDGVKNYCSQVKERGEDVLFLRRIERGGADKSFGVHVARLAGVPREVVARAHEIQARLEVSDINQNRIGQNILGREETASQPEQFTLFDPGKQQIIDELRAIDIMALTPMDAINKLYLLREMARK
ncbi:MAG: DNA mismatch repair protein MutS [Clostridia bacterium]|nr:DNA mismatch repair protein MutS [Clostridia bacterium]